MKIIENYNKICEILTMHEKNKILNFKKKWGNKDVNVEMLDEAFDIMEHIQVENRILITFVKELYHKGLRSMEYLEMRYMREIKN